MYTVCHSAEHSSHCLLPASLFFSSASFLLDTEGRLVGDALAVLDRVCLPPALLAFNTGRAALACQSIDNAEMYIDTRLFAHSSFKGMTRKAGSQQL